MRYRFLILVLLVATPASGQIIQRHDYLPGIEFGDGWVKDTSKHHDWSVTGTDTIHADRITEASVTQHEGAINHDNLSGFVANEHVDWTSTTSNLSTTGTGTFSELVLSDNQKITQGDSGAADYAQWFDGAAQQFDCVGDFVFSGGHIGVGTPNPLATLHVVGANGLLRVQDGEADSTLKSSRIVGGHYLSAEEPIGFLYATSSALTNRVTFGGGSGQVNAATDLDFTTASDTTTTTGTLRVRINRAGNVLIGTNTAPTANATKVVALGDNGATDPTLGAETVAVWQNSGDIVVGSATADKTLRLASPVYECVFVDTSSVRVPPANAPTWAAYKGGYVLEFSAAADEIIYFTITVPAKYLEGGDLDFHAHSVYPDANAGDVRWNLTYSWANTDAVFPAETTVNTDIAASGVADRHVSESVATAISGTGKEFESVILCSLEREGTHANDDYGSSVYLVSMHFCMPVDTLGSRTKTSK